MEALTLESLYDKLRRFIRWLSQKSATDHPLLQPDELEGELCYELVHGFLYYENLVSDEEEMLRIIRRMLHNRVGELVYRFHITHRKEEISTVDIDSLVGLDDVASDGIVDYAGVNSTYPDIGEAFYDEILDNELTQDIPDPQELAEFSEDYAMFVKSLTPKEMEVVTAILSEDRRVRQQVILTAMRKGMVYKNPSVTITPEIVGEALHLDKKQIYKLWSSIRRKWRRIF